ncbi:A24 family peptidase, partial [Candidatus Woesearchaeota archaeon]|nr:A24 family peptidase [Candidatus Woesearchaeota archaeon]
MIAETIIFIIVLIALVIGTYTDFRTREVPDWLNYGLIFTGLGLRTIFSIAYLDWHHIVEGLLGLGAFFALALIMFYAGQWGGGDSKMVMGLGALIGLQLSWETFLLGFVINIVIFGAIFGLLFSVYLVIRSFRPFTKAFSKEFSMRKKQKWLVWGSTLALLAVSLFVPAAVKISVVVFAGLILISFYLFIYLKAVERSAML